MPEARDIYPNNNSVSDLQDLRGALLGFKAEFMDQGLSEAKKPIAGRLGDLLQPLLTVAKLLPPEAEENLMSLIKKFETDRKEDERETLGGRILEALFRLKEKLIGGKLPVESVRELINESIDQKFQTSSQKLGYELSALGISRTKSQGR